MNGFWEEARFSRFSFWWEDYRPGAKPYRSKFFEPELGAHAFASEMYRWYMLNSEAGAHFALERDLKALWEMFKCGGEEAKMTFGRLLEYRQDKYRVTLLGNRRQIRVWYGHPKYIKWDYADSAGEGVLFSAQGPECRVLQCAKILFPDLYERLLREKIVEISVGE